MPAMAMPTPMTPTPEPAKAPAETPATAASPSDFFRFQMIDIVLRDDGGLRAGFSALPARRRETFRRHDGRQRRSLRTCGKRGSARGKSKGEFQKVTAFHDISSFARCEQGGDFRRAEMNVR